MNAMDIVKKKEKRSKISGCLSTFLLFLGLHSRLEMVCAQPGELLLWRCQPPAALAVDACTRARFFEPQLREPRPPRPRARNSTASCCLEGIHGATTFGRKVAASFLWRPTVRQLEAQNAITSTSAVHSTREPTDPRSSTRPLSSPCRPSTTKPASGPIPWLPFVPHRPWLQHLSVLGSGSPSRRLTVITDFGSCRITQSQRAPGQARQAQRKVGPTLGVGTIDDHTEL